MNIFKVGDIVWVRQVDHIFSGMVENVIILANKRVYGYKIKGDSYTYEERTVYESKKLVLNEIMNERIDMILKNITEFRRVLCWYREEGGD